MEFNLAVLPGDGIGPEIIKSSEAQKKISKRVSELYKIKMMALHYYINQCILNNVYYLLYKAPIIKLLK